MHMEHNEFKVHPYYIVGLYIIIYIYIYSYQYYIVQQYSMGGR